MLGLMYLGHLLRKLSTQFLGIASVRESHYLYPCLGVISVITGIIFALGMALLTLGFILYWFRRPSVYNDYTQKYQKTYQRILITGAIMLIVAAFLLVALVLTEQALTTLN